MSGLGARFDTPAAQAWLRLWVDLYGPGSRLQHYLKAPDVDWQQPLQPRHIAPTVETNVARRRHYGKAPLEKAPAAKPRKSQAPRSAKPRDVAERRIRRDIDRTTRLPSSDWAKSIVGDAQIADIRLQDVLDGIEDYFEIFDELRKVSPAAHKFFSRIGAPVVLGGSAIWANRFHAPRIMNAASLPSYFGAFFAKPSRPEDMPTDQEREEGRGWGAEFQLFEKPKNHATVAPFGTTVFAHNSIHLKRGNLSRKEAKKRPWDAENWSYFWYVGVLPDGSVRALPHRFNRYQRLPNGDGVNHSSFEIPPGLYEISDTIKDPHEFARTYFNATVAFTAAATSGIQVTVKRGKRAARFGLPVTALKGVFADRAPAGNRRKAIIHLRLSHDRHMRDGRIIHVGEHLSGERFFAWRGYDVSIGVPGIHYPAPEGFNSSIWIVDDPKAPLPPDLDLSEKVGMQKLAREMATAMDRRIRVPIRRSKPTSTYISSSIQYDDAGILIGKD